MGIKEQLGDNRPYWKVAVSLLFSLSATILFIYLGLKAIFYFMPFVIGWILSVIAGPVVVFLEKRLRIMKKLGSAITIILVLAICIGVIYLIGNRMWKEVLTLVDNFPAMYEELEDGFSQIGSKGTKAFSRLPEEVHPVVLCPIF